MYDKDKPVFVTPDGYLKLKEHSRKEYVEFLCRDEYSLRMILGCDTEPAYQLTEETEQFKKRIEETKQPCGGFESDDKLLYLVREALYYNAENISRWLSEGGLDNKPMYEINLNMGRPAGYVMTTDLCWIPVETVNIKLGVNKSDHTRPLIYAIYAQPVMAE